MSDLLKALREARADYDRIPDIFPSDLLAALDDFLAATTPAGEPMTVAMALMLPEVRSGGRWIQWRPSPQHETHQIRVAGDDIYIRWTFHDVAGGVAWGRWRMQGVSLTDLDATCDLVAAGGGS